MDAKRSNWVPFEVTVRLRTTLDHEPGGPQLTGGSNEVTAGSSGEEERVSSRTRRERDQMDEMHAQ